MATSLPFATTTWLPSACTRRMGDELGDQRGTGVQRIKAEGGSPVVCLPCTTRQSGWLGGCFRLVEGGFETRRAKRRETATADLPCPRSAKSAAPVRHAVRSGCRGRPRRREWGRRLTATTACLSSGMTTPDHHMKPCVLIPTTRPSYHAMERDLSQAQTLIWISRSRTHTGDTLQ